MCVADVRTTINVLWQDGTRQRIVPSTSLEPFAVIKDHDFFPGERVVADAGSHGDEADNVDGGEACVGLRREEPRLL
jgi:ubiquitin-conjugating enzyme E2 O